jgi:hypothetical protein
MSQEIPRGTRAHTPDLDWSQIRETVLMLELAAGQVDAAMRDSNSSVDTLMDTFTSMASTLGMIDAALGTLPDTVGNGMVKSEIQEGARQVSQKDLVGSTERLYNPQQWSALQERIRSKYTMAEERGMFDAVMAGATVQDALKNYMTERMQKVEESSGEIELF